MATEYSSLRVPELKKLLAEKGLPQTGNKAELVARLQENDKKDSPQESKPAAENKEDEITYSDDEAPVATEKAEPAAAPAPAAASDATKADAAEPAAEPASESKEESKPAAEETPAAPAPNFALGLSSTVADDEAKKRADRAKRFGIEEDDESKKRAERAARFGLDEKELASSLDSALPERPLKRGRGRGEGEDSNRPGKRQSTDGRNPRRSGRNNNNNNNNNRGPAPAGGAKGGAKGSAKGGNQPKKSILDDPVEKAKAEKRAARFAS